MAGLLVGMLRAQDRVASVRSSRVFVPAVALTPRLLHPLLAHVAAFMAAQAVWWVFVGIAAIGAPALKAVGPGGN